MQRPRAMAVQQAPSFSGDALDCPRSMPVVSPRRMSVTIRLLHTDDAERLKPFRLRSLAAQPDAFHSTAEEWDKPIADFQEMIRDNPHFAAVDADGSIIGTAILGITARPKRQMQHKCELWAVFVSEHARGQGIARQLVEACIAEARRCGFEAILLTASTHLTHVVSLYESLGFRIYGTERAMVKLIDGRVIDDHLMELVLSP
jgi:ribosomal protein S18 acetylase RimI-like enzyme